MEWTDFFACWCKSRKTKSNFNYFWVDGVKSECDHLIHETLKSAEWVWIELVFCRLTVMQYFLVRPTSYSICLTFKCQFTAVLLVKPLAVAGRILWNRVCSSLPPGICLGVFLKLDHYISLNFGMMPENFLPPKIGKMGQKSPKIGFFEFKEKFKTVYILYWKFLFAERLRGWLRGLRGTQCSSSDWDDSQNPLS